MEHVAPRTGELDTQLRCALLAVLGGRPTPQTGENGSGRVRQPRGSLVSPGSGPCFQA